MRHRIPCGMLLTESGTVDSSPPFITKLDERLLQNPPKPNDHDRDPCALYTKGKAKAAFSTFP
jgi:hypothetical protein